MEDFDKLIAGMAADTDTEPTAELTSVGGCVVVSVGGQQLAIIQAIEGGIKISGNAIASVTAYDPVSAEERNLEVLMDRRMPAPPYRVLMSRADFRQPEAADPRLQELWR